MRDVLQFALLGLGAGAIYALLGQGLVLIYRGSGILNLAHGSFAMAGAYLYQELHVAHGWSRPAGMVGAVVVMALVGVITDQVLLRRLRKASALARLISTLGLLLIIQSIGVLRYGATPTLVEPIFTPKQVHILGATVSSDRLWLVAVVAVLTAVLWVVGRYSRLGWVMSAVSENPRAAAALGWSPERVSSGTWALGAGLAALAGILIAPITQLSVSQLTLIVIPALAAALAGGFTSFPLTLLGGLTIGIGESEVQRYLDLTGGPSAVALIMIAVVLLLRGSWLPLRGYVTDRLPHVGAGEVRPLPALAAIAVMLALIAVVLDDGWLNAVIILFSTGTILLSLVVLTGYSGQLSLGQFALAGFGALVAARLVQAHDVPFPLALIGGAVGALLFGLLFALPALRTRGVELAVITLSLGAACEAMLFNNADATSSAAGTPVGSPKLLGLDIGALDHPARYATFVFAVFVLCGLAVANLRRGRSGRRLLAVRTNERAASALGISVFAAKLHAFAVAGAIAGLGGILLGFRAPNVVYSDFSPLASIQAVANAVIGGIGFVLGAVFGATLSQDSIGQEVLGDALAEYLPLVGGVMLLALLMQAPDGFAHAARRATGLLFRTPARAEAPDEEQGTAVAVQRATPQTLTVEGLTVRFGGVVAVDGLSLTVGPGEVVGLIGPNGAGKTSVVDAVSGFSRGQGRIAVDEQDVSGWGPHARARLGLSRSFQSLELFEDMTVRENLLAAGDRRDGGAMVGDLVRPGAGRLTPVAQAAVEEFRLGDLLDERPTALSYGHRRLVAIARAVATSPSILLLDEPAAGLDDNESRELSQLVRRLADEWGIAVLVIEHNMEFVMAICDRVVVMEFGRLIAQGTASEVRDDPRAIAAYLGEDVEDPAGAEQVTA
jgi:sulfate-transporting ATPase